MAGLIDGPDLARFKECSECCKVKWHKRLDFLCVECRAKAEGLAKAHARKS